MKALCSRPATLEVKATGAADGATLAFDAAALQSRLQEVQPEREGKGAQRGFKSSSSIHICMMLNYFCIQIDIHMIFILYVISIYKL